MKTCLTRLSHTPIPTSTDDFLDETVVATFFLTKWPNKEDNMRFFLGTKASNDKENWRPEKEAITAVKIQGSVSSDGIK